MTGEYDERSEVLNRLYKDKDANIENELTSDIVGDYLFSNDDFIKYISQNQTLFDKIKKIIHDLVVRFKGTNQEKALLDLEKKFKDAYKVQSNTQIGNINYSLSNYVNIDKGTYIDYNGNTRKMTESMTAAYAVDERKSEYFKYNHIDKFYDLTFEEMKKASAVVSEAISKGNDTGYANDENRIYYYDVNEKDSKNYTITDLEDIDLGRKEIYDDGENENQSNRDSTIPLQEGNEQNGRNGNNNAIENSRTYQRNDGMVETKSASNNQGNDKKSITNTRLNENSKKGSFSLSENTIQGLENYSRDEIKQISKDYIKEKLTDNDLYDINIKGIDIHGSRNRGTANINSDLDIVVEYDGNIREDDLFNILNEEPLDIDGIKIDINPINENQTGTLEEYIKRSNEYDQEVLSKQNNKYSLSEDIAPVDPNKDYKIDDGFYSQLENVL